MKYNNIWDKYYDRLLLASCERLNRDDGYIKLTLAIIVSAGRDRDNDFLYTDYFEKMASDIKLVPGTIRLLFQATWNRIDKGLALDLTHEDSDDVMETDYVDNDI